MSDTMRETVFDYRSAFKYTKVLSDEQLFCVNSGEPEDDLNEKPKDYPLINRLVHKMIVFIFYSIFIITFPISAFFCLKVFLFCYKKLI